MNSLTFHVPIHRGSSLRGTSRFNNALVFVRIGISSLVHGCWVSRGPLNPTYDAMLVWGSWFKYLHKKGQPQEVALIHLIFGLESRKSITLNPSVFRGRLWIVRIRDSNRCRVGGSEQQRLGAEQDCRGRKRGIRCHRMFQGTSL